MLVHTDERSARRVMRRALDACTDRRVELGREILDLRRQVAKLERANKYLCERVAANSRRRREEWLAARGEA